MKFLNLVAGALVLVAPLVYAEAETMDRPSIVAAQTMTMSAQIVALDKENRLVTLKGPEGNERVIELGPEVKRIDEFEVGDVVVAEYLQELVIEVVAAEEGDEPGEGAMVAAARAPETERPGMIAAETRVKTARVAEIDLEKVVGQRKADVVADDVANRGGCVDDAAVIRVDIGRQPVETQIGRPVLVERMHVPGADVG